ncbi:helix-turn-helix domain-containing protein [Oryzomonas sagensis]|uniref:Helix-turn-helix domain-containing protein n=1 Tax=Oryzomonas sagensis TaxID=2603857 RepID=A0ABQ6TLI3_9BACT|nr:helix-turn-helix domain-containing protein [Oryzomonas sagensis]KAB0669291.1 helix-turn-helix domain-containing protein [Oryzomonas sagensis]
MSDIITNINKKQLTESEASELYGLSVHWFRRKRWEGGGPVFRKVGNRCYYERAALDDYFNSCTHKNTSEYPTRRPAEAINRKQATKSTGEA